MIGSLMHARSARFYDAIYGFKDYAGEAARVDREIQTRRPGARTLLDVACGTGGHLQHLAARYDAEGVDVSSAQIEVARGRVPGARLQVGDMLDLALDRRFDAVTCLFSAIGYTLTVERMGQAIAAMARHLAPGGVLIVEPWFTPEAWRSGRLSAVNVDRDDLKLSRFTIARSEGRRSILEMQYLVATLDGFEQFAERHELGLFTTEEQLAAFRGAGLAADHDPEGLGGLGRGLLIGVAQ